MPENGEHEEKDNLEEENESGNENIIPASDVNRQDSSPDNMDLKTTPSDESEKSLEESRQISEFKPTEMTEEPVKNQLKESFHQEKMEMESIEETTRVKRKSYKQQFKKAYKEAILAFKDVNFKSVSPMTYLVTIFLLVAFATLQFLKINLTLPLLSFVLPSNPLLIPLSLFIALLLVITWIAMGLTFAGPFARFLVNNKIAKLLFTKGDVHYIEYVPEEEDIIGFGLVVAKTIALIIAWAAMAATLFSVIASLLSIVMSGFDPAGLIVLDPTQRQQLKLPQLDGFTGPLVFIFQLLIIYILSPLLVTIIVPIPWMLIDARLKAFDSKKSKVNWFIGLKVQQRTRSIVSIAAIVGLGASYAIINRLEVIFQMVAIILVYMALPSVIISFLYLLLFQSRLRQEIIEACGVPLGKTTVELIDNSQLQNDIESRET